ncbi:MAG: hypothetical protein V3U69_01915, partial [Bacteroidota bacterium]
MEDLCPRSGFRLYSGQDTSKVSVEVTRARRLHIFGRLKRHIQELAQESLEFRFNNRHEGSSSSKSGLI